MAARIASRSSGRRARKAPRRASGSGKPTPRARAAQAERREAILAAALEEFSARGFAATRLDDVASRAGVAKGTIYLYFRDKESLFQELVRSMLEPAGRRDRGGAAWPICRSASWPSASSTCSCARSSARAART